MTILRHIGTAHAWKPQLPYECKIPDLTYFRLTLRTDNQRGCTHLSIALREFDARTLNAGVKHTKYHVTMPQEVHNELQGATVFSEIDMGNGFHEVPLSPEFQCVFQ